MFSHDNNVKLHTNAWQLRTILFWGNDRFVKGPTQKSQRLYFYELMQNLHDQELFGNFFAFQPP